MLQNAYFLAKIGADTAENERNLPKIGNYPTAAGRSHPHRQQAVVADEGAELRAEALNLPRFGLPGKEPVR